MNEWRVSTLRRAPLNQADAATFALRAHAAKNEDFRCGLLAASRASSTALANEAPVQSLAALSCRQTGVRDVAVQPVEPAIRCDCKISAEAN